jgi:hypothetical protein
MPLTAEDLQHVAARWAQALPVPPSERNKLLAKRMRALTAGDPWAYDIAKQDAKEFMWVGVALGCWVPQLRPGGPTDWRRAPRARSGTQRLSKRLGLGTLQAGSAPAGARGRASCRGGAPPAGQGRRLGGPGPREHRPCRPPARPPPPCARAQGTCLSARCRPAPAFSACLPSRRTGQIDARELRDRFLGIYGDEAAAQQLFVEMALLVPSPARRLQLLQAAPNVSRCTGGGGGVGWAGLVGRCAAGAQRPRCE